MFNFIWDEKLRCYCAEHNPTIRADKNGNVFGGGGTTIEQPSQPSVQSSISDWVQNYPAVFALQQEYAPQEAAQQLSLIQQYAQPIGQALKSAQEAMYPNETALTNTLTQQAQEGMSGDMPSWAKESYLDTMRAQLGDNALAGSGADYMSRGLLQQQNDWQKYYQNLGLSISGKQPVYSATQPTTSNYTSGFTPSGVMGYNAQNYSTAGNIYGNQLQNQASNFSTWMSPVSQGVGGLASGLGMGFALSSRRFKKNIKTWE